MKYCYVLLALFIWCSYSCSGNSASIHVVDEFPKVGELKPEIYSTPVSVLLPRYMGITGKYLYIYKEKEEYLFSVFRASDLTYLFDTGKRGSGPHDFNLLDTRSFSQTEGGFKVIEAGSNLLKDVVIQDKEFKVNASSAVYPQGVTSNGFYPLADSVYLSFGQLTGENEYSLLDKKTGEVINVGDYPDWCELEKGVPPFVAYLKTCAVHPEGKKFAAFYSRFKRIRFYDSQVELLKEIDVRVPPYETSYGKEMSMRPSFYIGTPYVTDKLIYVLCSKNAVEKDGETELHVWGWDGAPIACYSLGRRISLMAVDEERGKIIAWDRMVEDKFFVFDLPN